MRKFNLIRPRAAKRTYHNTYWEETQVHIDVDPIFASLQSDLFDHNVIKSLEGLSRVFAGSRAEHFDDNTRVRIADMFTTKFDLTRLYLRGCMIAQYLMLCQQGKKIANKVGDWNMRLQQIDSAQAFASLIYAKGTDIQNTCFLATNDESAGYTLSVIAALFCDSFPYTCTSGNSNFAESWPSINHNEVAVLCKPAKLTQFSGRHSWSHFYDYTRRLAHSCNQLELFEEMWALSAHIC